MRVKARALEWSFSTVGIANPQNVHSNYLINPQETHPHCSGNHFVTQGKAGADFSPWSPLNSGGAHLEKNFPTSFIHKWNNSLYPRSSLERGSSTVTAPLTPSTAGIRNQPWFALQHSQHIFILQRGCWAPAWCSGETEALPWEPAPKPDPEWEIPAWAGTISVPLPSLS